MSVARVTRSALAMIALAAALAASWTPRAAAAEEGRHASLDLLVFTQQDASGDPFRTEAFGYYSTRVALGGPVSDAVSLHANSAFALINSADPAPLPESIENAETTSASGRLVTLTTSGTVAIRAGDWSFDVSGYYHQQKAQFIPGASIHIARELAGGDASISFDYALRRGLNKRKSWDGQARTREFLGTHNLLLTYTQVLSPEWLASVSVQFTRQVGFQSAPLNFVVVYEDAIPVRLIDEALPLRRDRAQLNARARWSPRLGMSLGLDASGYLDDWGIRGFALEPSLELPFGDIRWRGWYRLSIQGATDYFAETPTDEETYRTQDSDLASFSMHNIGTHLGVPVGPGAHDVATVMTVSAYGFRRSDGLYGLGLGMGAEWNW